MVFYLVIDLIGQLSRDIIGVCQLSRDVIGYKDSPSHCRVLIPLLSQLLKQLFIVSQIVCCPVIQP